MTITQTEFSPYTNRYKSIEQRFREFHTQHPEVYRELVRLAREAKSNGYKRIGMKMLFELLRWEWRGKTNQGDFKLNNDFSSLYAREIEDCEFGFRGFFEKRKRHAA